MKVTFNRNLNSPVKQRPTLNDITHDASRFTPRHSVSYEQKPFAFMVDSNVHDSYSAYRVNVNMGASSPNVKTPKIRQGFFGELYRPDNQYGNTSTNYTLSHSNISMDNIQSPTLRGNPSLSRLDGYPELHQSRHEYQFYPPQPQLVQPQYIPQDPFNRTRYSSNHAFIQKNYLNSPTHASHVMPSLHETHYIKPGYQAYHQPMMPPMQMSQAQPRRRSVRQQQDNAEGSLLKIERLMRDHNSHLEKLLHDMEANSSIHSERHHRRDSSLESVLRSKDGGSLQHLDHSQKANRTMRQGDDSPLKLPEIGKKDSSIKSPLGKISDDVEEDDNSPSNFRSQNLDKKKNGSSLLSLTPMHSNRSSGYLPELKSPTSLQLQHVKSTPAPRSGFGALIEEEEETSRPVTTKESSKKKKNKKNKNKHDTSIEVEEKAKDIKAELRHVLWAMAYPALLGKIIEKKVNQRKEKFEHNSMKMLQDHRTSMLDFINKHCITAIKNVYKEGKTMTLINENLDTGTQTPDKELKKRLGVVLANLTDIVESLKTAITSENLPKNLINFLADVSDKSSAIPPKFLTEFEISCLDVSYYGTLRNMSPIRTKMIVGMFLLVKGLIYVFLGQPWTFIPKMKESSGLNKKLKPCSSVLYHIVMDYFREHIEVTRNNQAVIAPEKRIKPLKNPLSVFTDADDFKKPSQDTMQNEVIIGLHGRYELKKCLDLDKASVEKLKTLVADCLDKLFAVVEEAQKEKRNADNEE